MQSNSLEFAELQSYPLAEWRVITHREDNGAMNMAMDEALAESVGAGRQPPTLRFYAWEPACLSLGYSQPAGDVDWVGLKSHGWDVVRRLTGGRAILHRQELTYSLSIPVDDPRVAGSIVESYQRLSRGLLAGLELLGAAVRSEQSKAGAKIIRGPVCFEAPSDYEITLEGRKLVGSAQTRRHKYAILQHGTLPLTGDLRWICDVLQFEDESSRQTARQRVKDRAITLEEGLGQAIAIEDAARALQKGMEATLNLRFIPGDLDKDELRRAEMLKQQRYASDEWTKRL